MELEKRRYLLKGLTPILGSSPANPDIYTSYIASRAPAPFVAAAEVEALPEMADRDDKGVTVFLREPDQDALALRNYQILGFLKEAMEALREQLKIAQPRSKVDRYVFVDPLWLPLMRDGQAVLEEDSVFERPLRAETMRGPRVTLASSEQVNTPWAVEIEITLLSNAGTKKSEPVTWEAVETALSYGRLKGLGQYRNGSFGRFEWERLDG